MPINPLMIIQSLPDNAPELIREVNPLTWFERIIHEGNQYKLAKAEIERACERDKNELKLQLEELATRKAAYIATLEHQIKLIETENAPIMESLNSFFRDLNTINQMAYESHKKILDSAGSIDSDIFKNLIVYHATLFEKRKDVYQQISLTLDNHKSSINNQFEKIHQQITEHTRSLGKGQPSSH